VKRVDILTLSGLIGGFALIGLAIFLGGNLGMFWNIPSVLVTVGGSAAAVTTSFGRQQMREVVEITRKAFREEERKPLELIELFSELARKARREGLLALEDDITRLDDSLFQKGIQMVVDALDPQTIRDILETDIESMAERHEQGERIYRVWASLAPAFGMIGTLIGLIQMLAKLQDPSSLGPGMALALITTFYGAIMANLVFTPMANKLRLRGEEEVLEKRIILEGIISIQSGINPRVLEERLKAYLPPKLRQPIEPAA